MFAQLYPPGRPEGFVTTLPIGEIRAALAESAPAGVTTHLTGVDPIFESQGEASGPSRGGVIGLSTRSRFVN